MKIRILTAALCLSATVIFAVGCQSGSSETNTEDETTESESFLGQVTKIEDKTITIALGERSEKPEGGGDGEAPADMGDGGTPPDKEEGGTVPSGEEGDTPPDMKEGGADSGGEDGGTPPDMKEGDTPSSGEDGGTPPEGGKGMPGGLTLTGEEKTITVDDSVTIQLDTRGETAEGSLEDISEGSVLTVEMKGDTVVSITVTVMGGPGGGGTGSDSSAGSIELKGVREIDGTSESSDSENLTSSASDENVLLVKNGGELSMTNGTLNKSGDGSSSDESNFYGVNAIVAVSSGSNATISGTTLTSSSEGSNAIFATGEGSTVTVSDITIHTTGNSSRGLDATYGGSVIAANVDITTEGAHCAPIATDRGEGTIQVTGGTLSSAGEGSPCIYSTGSVTVSNVTGTSAGSQAAVVEGKNSITLSDCNLTGAGSNGIMLYQSTSGDAEEGTAAFSSVDSTITSTSDGPFFYVTNTNAEAALQNTTLVNDSGILVTVSGNETNNWGTPGSNGGSFSLTGISQTLEGDIKCDEISTMNLALTQSSALTGSVNQENTAKEITLSLDTSSTWELTGDAYLTAITDEDTACGNISSNGYTIYYDASNSTNSWLDGQTLELSGGGSLTPIS